MLIKKSKNINSLRPRSFNYKFDLFVMYPLNFKTAEPSDLFLFVALDSTSTPGMVEMKILPGNTAIPIQLCYSILYCSSDQILIVLQCFPTLYSYNSREDGREGGWGGGWEIILMLVK